MPVIDKLVLPGPAQEIALQMLIEKPHPYPTYEWAPRYVWKSIATLEQNRPDGEGGWVFDTDATGGWLLVHPWRFELEEGWEAHFADYEIVQEVAQFGRGPVPAQLSGVNLGLKWPYGVIDEIKIGGLLWKRNGLAMVVAGRDLMRMELGHWASMEHPAKLLE